MGTISTRVSHARRRRRLQRANALQQSGYHVATAATPTSAELVALERCPGAVVADDSYGAARLQSLRDVLLGTQACPHSARFICLVGRESAARELVEASFHAAWLKRSPVEELVARIRDIKEPSFSV